MLKKIIPVILGMAMLSMTTFASAEEVYVTKNGKKFHKEATCRFISKRESHKAERAEVMKKGLEPCQRCFKSKTEAVEK